MKRFFALSALFVLFANAAFAQSHYDGLHSEKALGYRPDGNSQQQYQDGSQYDAHGFDSSQEGPGFGKKLVYVEVEETVYVRVYNRYTGRYEVQPKTIIRRVPRYVDVEPMDPLGPWPRPDIGNVTARIDELGIGVERTGTGQLRVAGVQPMGVGGQMGLQVGDILLELNGRRVQSLEQLRLANRSSIQLKYYRPSSRTTHWGSWGQSIGPWIDDEPGRGHIDLGDHDGRWRQGSHWDGD